MFFTLKPGKTLLQECRDQGLHMLECSIFFYLFITPVPILLAGLLAFVVGVRRELEQHKWDWRAMGRQDLFFWALAAIILVAVYLLKA